MSNPFLHRNLPRLLLQAREAVMAHTRPHLRDHGLTDQQWRVLRVLGERQSEGGVDAGTIAREAFISAPSLSGVLVRMERDGLVRRFVDARDARRAWIETTPRGRRLVARLSEAIEAHYAMLESSLGVQSLEQLYALLDQLIAVDAPVAAGSSCTIAPPLVSQPEPELNPMSAPA